MTRFLYLYIFFSLPKFGWKNYSIGLRFLVTLCRLPAQPFTRYPFDHPETAHSCFEQPSSFHCLIMLVKAYPPSWKDQCASCTMFRNIDHAVQVACRQAAGPSLSSSEYYSRDHRGCLDYRLIVESSKSCTLLPFDTFDHCPVLTHQRHHLYVIGSHAYALLNKQETVLALLRSSSFLQIPSMFFIIFTSSNEWNF